MSTRKPLARIELETPYRTEHARADDARLRHPQSLRDYITELRQAVEAENPDKLHEQGTSDDGSPRWRRGFLAYIAGSAYTTYEADGQTFWQTPHRSALARMNLGESDTTRLAAEFVYLLPRHRYNVREAWAKQVGMLAAAEVIGVAEAWAADALGRWWRTYIQQPRPSYY